jgi:hemerythrin
VYSIKWDEKLMGSGVNSVDAQHKELIKMLNAFREATCNGSGDEELGKMLDFLGNYAKMHFRHEELVMEQHHCPMAQRNQEEHAKFLEDFGVLANRFKGEGASHAFVMEVQVRVMRWLTNHICGCDAKLRQCPSVKAA